TTYSSDSDLNIRLADLKRSLGSEHPANYDAAAKIREHLAQITPSDSSLWTTAGETVADVEQYDQAKAYWQKILAIDPKNPERYLEVATILWDYYLFDDGLVTIAQARKVTTNDGLYAYEAGAIQESRRDYPKAISEYVKSLVSESSEAKDRL